MVKLCGITDDASDVEQQVNTLAIAYVSNPSARTAERLAQAMQPELKRLAKTARRRDVNNPAARVRPMEEYLSDANVAAWECLQTFDPVKGAFTRFARHTISMELVKMGVESRSGAVSVSSQTIGRAFKEAPDSARREAVVRALSGQVTIAPGTRPHGSQDSRVVYEESIPALDDFTASSVLAMEVREAFTELREHNERYAHFLYLAIYEGLSVAEVAVHEGVTPNTAKVVIRRARAAFKKIAVARGIEEML